jgi:hypothetical protein
MKGTRAQRPIPAHRKLDVTWDGEREARRRLIKSEFCSACNKLTLRTRAEAHSYIALLISTPGHLPRSGESTLAPYKCPRGAGWHVGRNIKTAALLQKGK